MRRWCVALALLLVSLSGCASGPDSSTPPAETVSASTTQLPSTSIAPGPVLRTDTLHLLDAPHMVGTLLPRSQDIRTPVLSDSMNINQARPAEWLLPLSALMELKATLRLYIDVEGVVTAGFGGSVCFWALQMAIEHADGTRDGLNNYCYREQPLVPTGIRLLEFTAPQTLDSLPAPGDRLVFELWSAAVYAPGSSVDILSGTLEHDSSLTIDGLQLPIDTQTLL